MHVGVSRPCSIRAISPCVRLKANGRRLELIRYTLCCDQGHDFESWFRDSEAYDAQKKRKLVTCPICQSPKVEKTIMAPQVARKDRGGINGPLLPVDLPENDSPVRAPSTLLPPFLRLPFCSVRRSANGVR